MKYDSKGGNLSQKVWIEKSDSDWQKWVWKKISINVRLQSQHINKFPDVYKATN